MKTIVCKNCGKMVVVKGEYQKLFCSPQCGMTYRYRRRKIAAQSVRKPQCRFNEGVECAAGDCAKCGWNPAVENERKESL